MRIFTVGHGARPIDELLEVLAGAGVRTLVDVRRFPGSRRHPQFDQGALAASLEGAGIAAAGLCVAVGLVLADLVRGRDVPGLVWLLLPGVPTLAGGQLWGIAVLLARRRRNPELRPRRFPWRDRETDPRRFFFEGLPLRQANGLIAIFCLAWLSAVTALPVLTSGKPASPAPGCRYRLVNRGDYSCVSRSRWLAAGSAEQRFAAGVFAAFFAAHLGIAAAELRRRRVERGA